MRRLFPLAPMAATLLAFSAVALITAGPAGVALAAPKEGGKNVEVIPVDCGGLGTFEVVSKFNAASAFGPDGEVFVAKLIFGETSGTITTHDGQTFPFSDSVTDHTAHGKGFEDRLIPCSFSDTFADTFIVDEAAAAFLGIPVKYVGTAVTLAGTSSGTAWVTTPGR